MGNKQVFINGLKINYKKAGEGPALLILHGWGGSSNSWLVLQKILVEAGYQVILPDFPGFGESASPKNVWSVRNYTDFVLNFLQKLNLEEVFLLGHSFGGRVAIKFTRLYPEKVKKLILCDSAGIKPKLGFKTRFIIFLSKLGQTIFKSKYLVKFKNSFQKLFYFFLRKKDYVRVEGIMKEVMKKVLAEDLLPELLKIEKETLIIWGEKDKLVPLKDAYLFQEKIKGSQLEIIPQVGHSPHLETPDQLAEKIINFLKKVNDFIS